MGAGCEVSKFRACNCVGMVSEDGSKQNLPDALTIEDIEANLKLVRFAFCFAVSITFSLAFWFDAH